MTITEFLLARIADDEAVARATLAESDLLDWSGNWSDAVGLHGPADGPSGHAAVVVDPARVLAECAGKRRIAELHARCDVHDRPGDECDACQRCGDGSLWPCDTLLAVASVYADHPDFDPAWEIDPPA